MRELGPTVVIKPLGPGHFTTSDKKAAVVYATLVDLRDPAFTELGPSPFLIQEQLLTKMHLRVVTVKDQSWVTALDGAGLPLDWRSEEAAHSSFVTLTKAPLELSSQAVELARSLGLGYSSQDWVCTESDELVLLDVNPSGQWLFLPDEIGSDVARAIAAWLRGS